MLEYSLETDEKMGWANYVVKIDGIVVTRINDKTRSSAVHRFFTLCQCCEGELSVLCKEVEEKREWNRKHPNEAKNWPVFGKKERYLNQLLKRAGIKDT